MDKEFSGQTKHGTSWVSLKQAKETSAYVTASAIKERMAAHGFDLDGMDFAYSSGKSNYTHLLENGKCLVEIGTESAAADDAGRAIGRIEKGIKSSSFAPVPPDSARLLAKHAFEAFFLLHEIGHANAHRMEFLNSGLNGNRGNVGLFQRIYEESYADAFAVSYMKRLGLHGELVEMTGLSVEQMRKDDERVLTKAVKNNGRSAYPWMSGKDFEHDTGSSISEMLGVADLAGMRTDLLQQKIKEIAEGNARRALSNPVVQLFREEEKHPVGKLMDLEKVLDVCIVSSGLPVIDFGKRRSFLDCKPVEGHWGRNVP